ncbi:GPI ethanolamine phosphate transferase 2 [Cydia pomonella]|uniref:GPI ethanolamine phosphate transferase 2 n=1 Tax=Cydia pomonella TaxID=82600 RepID=UPI002ADE8B47|nr:GPI ethanolamine phosphate transferase 2 [Cydia pomonella]
MLSWVQHRWTGLCLLVMGLGALMLFMFGFFPLKYHSGNLAHMNNLPNFIGGVSIDGQEVYNSGENTVVLMVIDGLRYDFVTEEYMPYTGQLLKNKSACIYVSVAEPPTVTMPRIKSPELKKERAQWRRTINFWRDIFAMMTGSVSTFADVALNFGAPAVRGDSVLRVAAERGRRSVMYGDDTWLRLFPGLWAESDGTTSFYVTDYTEVDNNVTRHLDKVLTPDDKKKPTFDFLVLHYLGLDHIGHLEGARSPKIKPKLQEMDDVVKKIFEAMQKWDRPGTLFVCGDHGMRDAGGHGGSTPAEVLVPLVAARTDPYQCPHPDSHGPTVGQVDLAPTIAWLLNAPPPGDSTGRVLPGLLPAGILQRLYLLHITARHNADQCAGKAATETEFYKQFERAEKQFAHYLATGEKSAAKIAKEFYEDSLEKMAEYLTEATVGFDLFAIGVGIVLLYCIALSLGCITLYSLQPETSRKHSVHRLHATSTWGSIIAFISVLAITNSILVLSCYITETKTQFCSMRGIWLAIFLLVSCVLTMSYWIIKTSIEKIKDLSLLRDLNAIDYLLIIGTLFHSWSFFGTSFIEEEHMTWYFFWNTLMFFILIRTVAVVVIYLSRKLSGATEVQEKPELEQRMSAVGIGIVPKWVLLIALHRYLRTMNQTGDRWLFLPDTADWLKAPENAFYLQAHLVIGTVATLGICLYNLRYTNNLGHLHTIFTTAAALCIFCYRIATDSLDSPFEDIKSWDTVHIVNVFWVILIAQFIFEFLTYVGVFKNCGVNPATRNTVSSNRFDYNKSKAKTEDYFYEPMIEEPWNLEDVKLNLARSMSHLMLNDLMLIIALLMRPHNVIMVPSVYITCVLTSECIDHKLLDSRSGRNTEVVDILSQTLVHVWIGCLFFFYQGNSNSLASVDLGSGYVGLRSYCAVRVALRMGVHAYAGPALAGAALYCRLAAAAPAWTQYLQTVWRATNIFALQRVYSIAVYCVVATVFRHHLFVWTVFSPKLLYDFVAMTFTIQALVTIAEIIGLTHLTSWIAQAFVSKSRL